MKDLIASVMAGSLVLMAAPPAAGQAARLVSNVWVHDSANDRGAYIQGAPRSGEMAAKTARF
jgi:hypothetical protein